MKPIRALPLALFLLVGAAAPALRPAPASPAAAAVQEDFTGRFRAAMKVGATDEMNRLVRTNEEKATYWVIDICKGLTEGPSERLEQELAALTQSWHAVFKTSFPDRMQTFFKETSQERLVERHKQALAYEALQRRFVEAEKNADQEKFAALGPELNTVGEAFSALGDHYYASLAYILAGKAYDEPLRKDKADLPAALLAYQKSMAEREQVDLKDAYYVSTRDRVGALEHLTEGAAAPAGGPAGPEAPPPVVTPPLATTFEVVPDIELYRRPIYSGDSTYPIWNSINLAGKGSTTKFSAVVDSPIVGRTASSEVKIDGDRDGKLDGEADIEIPLTGKLTPVRITLGDGDTKREWAFLTAIGGDKDTYNGIEFNLGPNDDYLAVYVAPAASLVTTIAGTPVRVLDDNMDGFYGSPPATYGFQGLVSGYFQPELDSLVVGESKVAVPWSEYVQVGTAWFMLESAKFGNELRATPAPEIQTGTLKLDLKGVPVDWLVVKGVEKTPYERCYFDLASAKLGLAVPAGSYQVYAGQVGEGSKLQKMKALVLPSKSSPTWTVRPGETATVELGAPFTFDFTVHQDATKLTVVGDSIAIKGKSGETYQRLWNCVVRPEVFTREAGKKRGSKGESMKGAESQQEVGDKGFQYAWFPFDFMLEKKAETNLETQLIEKKNKLFGKIESDWK